MSAFGAVIPVLGLNLGFLGEITRIADRLVTARQVLSTTPSNINFGDPAVIVPTTGGGDTLISVADYITANGAAAFSATNLAGVAVREVKTNLTYSPALFGLSQQTNYYAPGEMAEILSRGSILVNCRVGTPVSQGSVYIRATANGAIPAGVVGGFEAAADGSVTGAAAAGNTGNGTIGTLSSGAAAAPGVYRVVFTAATAFNVFDPNNNFVGSGTTGTAFVSSQVTFTITAGGTAFVKNDGFNITSVQNNIILRHVEWRTGVLDGNNTAEITMLERLSA